jgi:hypothetical protein
MFDVPTRREAARQLEAYFRAEAELGNYDHVDTRPGATSRGINEAPQQRGRVRKADGRPRRPHGGAVGANFDRDVQFLRRHGEPMSRAYDLALAAQWWRYDRNGTYTYREDGETPGEEHMTVAVGLVDENENVVDETFGVPNTDADIWIAAADMALARMPGRRSGRAAEAPHRDDERKFSMTYGVLPPWEQFKSAVRRVNPDEGKPYLPEGAIYPMELVDSAEIELADQFGLVFFPTSRPGYAYGYKGNDYAIYNFIAFLVEKLNDGDDTAGNLASSIMYSLGYEWI